jgi:hypothetical protein
MKPEDSFAQAGFVLTAPLLAWDDWPDAAALAQAAGTAAGTRNLLELDWCARLAAYLRTHHALAPLLPLDAVAVQCTLFEKSAAQNWLVPLHQDLSIPVQERRDHPELGGWSTKEGTLFVQAPPHLLAQMVAVRLQIDPGGERDGALRIVPGSHLHGRLSTQAASAARERGGEISCPVAPGAALVMRPLLLHASAKASGSSRRRVLHYLFGPRELPYQLQWRHAL